MESYSKTSITNLRRSLTPLDGAALIFANVVGVGIFTTPGIIYKSVSDSNLILTIWLAGGLLAFIGALAYGNLARLYPQSGGEYIYLSKCFGPMAGFLTGYTSFVAGFSGAIAASSVGFSTYLRSLFFFQEEMIKPIAIIIIGLVSVLHIVGVKLGSRFHYFLGIITIAAVFIIITWGNLITSEISSSTKEIQSFNFSSWFLALIPVMFTYSGWNAAVYVAEEIKDPEKNMMKSLLIGTLLVIIFYVLLNLLYLKFIPPEEISNSINVGYLLSIRLFGESGSWMVTIIILASLLSSISAMVMAGPRIYFAMARDGVFPSKIRNLHSRFGTPYIAILSQSAWSILLILSGSFEQILIYTGFTVILFSALSVISLVIIKYRNKQNIIFSFNGFSYLVFIIVSFIVIFNGIKNQPLPSLAGSGVVLLGIPLYYILKRFVRT